MTSKRKKTTLPELSPWQYLELEDYFDGDAPAEPGCQAPRGNGNYMYVADPEAQGRVKRSVLFDHGRSEDEMLEYISAKRKWDAMEARLAACSDETVSVLQAWFATDEKDRARAFSPAVLSSACKEYAGKS
jgi:hypothetical protein